MRTGKQIGLVVLLMLVLSGGVLAQSDPVTLRVVTHDSFNVSEDVLNKFQEESGITVEIVRLGDAGAMVNQVVLSKDNPLGDVLYGIDNTFLSRGLDADIFEPYESPLLENVPDDFKLDEDMRVTPIDYGDICLNFDVSYFEENQLTLPETLKDLTKPEYKGLLVTENPATSSPGLAFLLASVAVFGEEGDYTYLDYWADLVKNEVLVDEDWSTAYYGDFTVPSEEGERPLVVSYASSPPAEVFFADPPVDNAPTGSVIADDTCFRQIEFTGILKGTANLEAAQQFIDFMLSVDFQNDMPLQMFVFPVNQEAELPEVFAEYAAIPEKSITLDSADIEKNREGWIEKWTEVVLR
ncbi:MAG TPA: thiamine ABC transporter substrate-binding protein [Phototrophicaceae bacterium]|jgi:thiamine transport system substrate-binding protein|nr:thiamine ABC transporter substrate-binding protein [Phototrophicaceae bacterium]